MFWEVGKQKASWELGIYLANNNPKISTKNGRKQKNGRRLGLNMINLTFIYNSDTTSP